MSALERVSRLLMASGVAITVFSFLYEMGWSAFWGIAHPFAEFPYVAIQGLVVGFLVALVGAALMAALIFSDRV